MRFSALPAFALLLLFALPACSSALSGSWTGSSSISGNRDLITIDEIQGNRLTSVIEVVQRPRSNWLGMRGTQASTRGEPLEVAVFVNSVRPGGVEAVREMSTARLERLQWIDGPSATQRWGTGYAAGAILVTTRGTS